MRAASFGRYGGPEVLELVEAERPVPRPGEVLVRVRATTVTPSDCLMRSGASPAGRMITGIFRPRRKYRRLGIEFAGTVEELGAGAARFEVGDAVYGFRAFGEGCCAEYKRIGKEGSIGPMPAGAGFEAAAALVDSATTALFFLRDKGGLQAGQRLLVIGAAGGIGSMAVQIAAHLGARVTGVCGAANAGLVRGLGAEEVIDYSKEDFAARGDEYDLIFDAVGKSDFRRCRDSLVAHGKYLVTTGNMLVLALRTLATSLRGGKKHVFALSVRKDAALLAVKEMFEAGKLRPLVDRVYSLDQLAEAHRYVEAGHKRGSVVIKI